MTVTVINQSTTSTARVNWILYWVVKLFHPSLYPTPDVGPSDALQAKPWGFERSYNVSISRLHLDLPMDWVNRAKWPPLYMKRNATKSKRILIYYHGGGFVNTMASPQWGMVGGLANGIEADAMIQTYIMAPHGGIHENIDNLIHIYQKIYDIAKREGKELIIGGDSAGASITAAMLLALNDKQLPLPDQAIMLAPPMINDFDLPENRAIEPFDPVLSVDKFSAAVRAWATGPTDRAKIFSPAPPATAEEKAKVEHPYAAPLYGNWEFAAKAKLPITISQGTYDILLPQVDEFVKMAKALDLELTYIRAEKACHVYPMMSVLPGASYLAPDSVEGMRLIVESVKRYSKV